MKKKFTNFLAIALAFSMATATVTPAFADSANPPADASITVEALDPGDKVTFYKVFDWDDTQGWVLTTPFQGELTQAEIDTILGTPDYWDAQQQKMVPGTKGTIDYATASKIAGLVKSKNVQAFNTDLPLGANPAIAGNNGIASLPTDKSHADVTTGATIYTGAGLYIGLVTPKNPNVVYNPVFVGSDYTNGGISTPLDLSQKAANKNGYNDYASKAIAKKDVLVVDKTEGDQQQQIETALSREVGQDIYYSASTDLPVFSKEYTTPQFIMTDVVSKGLKLDTATPVVVLTNDAGTPLAAQPTKDTDYTVVTDTITDATLGTRDRVTVTFAENWLKTNETPNLKVKLTYKAKVTNAANFNINYDENDVTVKFSNDPANGIGLIKDRTNNYTYSIGVDSFGGNKPNTEVVKIAQDKQGRPVVTPIVNPNVTGETYGPLAGVTFGIFTDQACTQKFTNDVCTGTVTTGATGVVTFKGLKGDKDYFIKELHAPAGYVMSTTVYKVHINETFNNVDVNEFVSPSDPQKVSDTKISDYIEVNYKVNELKQYDVVVTNTTTGAVTHTYDSLATITSRKGYLQEAKPNVSSVKIINTPGTELPSTGGIGTTLFYIIGGALVVVAGVMLATKRRMAKEEA